MRQAVGPIGSEVLLGGRYRVVGRIASGGMGAVWQADDTVLRRRVAVKTLAESLASDHDFVQRFRREARSAAGLSHPNVASVFDYGEDDGTPYIVMELLQGRTLAERLRSGSLPWEQAAAIAEAVAAALQAAHEAGIVHRDVKPGNIMLTEDGGVKVMDFGIAAASWDSSLTVTGMGLGTASYVSPEQASGGRATGASDVYALGVVLYEMLAGRPPFVAPTPVAVAAAHVHEQPLDVGALAPEAPPAVVAACMQALAKDPSRRPPSAAAFAAMLGPAPTVPSEHDGAPPATADRTEVLPVVGSPAPAAQTAVIAPNDVAGVPRLRRSRPPVVPWLLLLALIGLLALVVVLARAFASGSPAPATSPTTTRVAVPAVVGLTADRAKQRLARAGLRVGSIDVVDGPAGVVRSTHPSPGTPVAVGASVVLDVGSGPTRPPPSPQRKGRAHKPHGKKGGNEGGGGD